MKFTKNHATAAIVIALILCAIQAGIWSRSTAHDRTETDKIDTESQHSPTEIPGVAGFTLLVLAGVLVAIPRPPWRE